MVVLSLLFMSLEKAGERFDSPLPALYPYG